MGSPGGQTSSSPLHSPLELLVSRFDANMSHGGRGTYLKIASIRAVSVTNFGNQEGVVLVGSRVVSS